MSVGAHLDVDRENKADIPVFAMVTGLRMLKNLWNVCLPIPISLRCLPPRGHWQSPQDIPHTEPCMLPMPLELKTSASIQIPGGISPSGAE